jgi:hypothetical protein
MRDYRAYILGIDGHRFVWVADFSPDHPDDAAALNAAKQLTDEHEVEVWDGGRLVALLSPGRAEMSPALAPSFPPDCGKIAAGPAELISPSRVSEFVKKYNPFMPRADEVTK